MYLCPCSCMHISVTYVLEKLGGLEICNKCVCNFDRVMEADKCKKCNLYITRFTLQYR